MINTYLNEIGPNKPLSSGRELELALAIACGGDGALAARRELLVHNLKFVVAVAKGFERTGLPLEDLIQEGNLGMWRATQDFDGRVRFCSYASAWVRKYMMDAIAAQARPLRIPNRVMQAIGEAPPAAPLDEVMGLEGEPIDRNLTRLEDDTEKKVAVSRLLGYLTAREAMVIRFTFGLGGHPAITGDDLGEKLGCSGQNVRATRARAMQKLKGASCRTK